MRIGFDISKALSPNDGVGNYTRQLLEALAELAPEEDIRLYSLTENIDPEDFARELPGCPYRLIDGRPRPEHGLDLFHANTWAYPTTFDGPVVFTCYDLTFLSHPDFHTLDNKVHSLTGTLHALLAGATLVAISDATCRELEERLEVPAERVRRIYPAAAPIYRRLAREQAQERVLERFAIEGPYLLAVGTLEPRKNLRRLVEAYDDLPDEVRAGCPLLVAGGQGWRNEAFTRLIEARTGPGEVRLLGWVSNEDLVALYGAAQVFAYPSLAEGFGLPVIEAMACGAPVVTSNRSSLAEVGGTAAHLADPESIEALSQALHELLTDAEARAERRRASLEQAARFSWAETARETLGLYRELTARPRA